MSSTVSFFEDVPDLDMASFPPRLSQLRAPAKLAAKSSSILSIARDPYATNLRACMYFLWRQLADVDVAQVA